MRGRLWMPAVTGALLALTAFGQFALRARRPASAPALAEGALAAVGGLRSIAAEVIWFRADRLQEEGRYVELAQLASALTLMEPQPGEHPAPAVLVRDEGLVLNPRSPELLRELAWLFELKLGTSIDSAAPLYRERWKAIVEDVRARGAWDELRMDPKEMLHV